MQTTEILSLLTKTTKTANGWDACCPAHADKNASLSIKQATDGNTMLCCHAGCDIDSICAAIGIQKKDLFAEKLKPIKPTIVATYDYHNIDGNVIFQVVRMSPKSFRQRQPDGKNNWIWNMKGITRELYHLPKVIEAIECGETVYIVEGEKDVATLEGLGLVATCNAGGGCKWQDNYTASLKNANIVIIPDNDTTGYEHAELIRSSIKGVAQSVTVSPLPKINTKNVKDVTDYVKAGATVDDILSVVKNSGTWTLRSALANLNKRESKPWEGVTDQDVVNAVKGSALAVIIKELEAVTSPPLPITATLPKALVLAGAALSQVSPEMCNDDNRWGVTNAKLVIDTAGGQGCNIYALLSAVSGTGKDIGSLLDRHASNNGWSLGSCGSPEGIADSLMEVNNGILAISEFQNFVDSKHWQSKAAPFLTDSFSKGYFKYNMSKRGKTEPRETKYCLPSIMANIQPATMKRYATQALMDNGFLQRFLVTSMKSHARRPAPSPSAQMWNNTERAISCYKAKRGKVECPNPYLDDLFNMFNDNKAPLMSHWMRLVNEYGPRFAVMLSVDDRNGSPDVVLSDDCWERASLLVRWFYCHGVNMMGNITENESEAEYERLLTKIFNAINATQPTLKSSISKKFSRGTNATIRNEILAELVERGAIKLTADNKYITLVPSIDTMQEDI